MKHNVFSLALPGRRSAANY